MDAPPPKHHRRDVNPYRSKFGDNWKHHCDKTALKNQACITDLIDHMFETTKKFFNPNGGDKNEWWVYHDALSLMTANESIKYMKDKGYYRHWILPERDLMNDGTGKLKFYANKPVGNSPEVMPLDCSLNWVLHSSVAKHVVLTKHLDNGDENKFSTATPKEGLAAYKRVWEFEMDDSSKQDTGAPTGKNIGVDVCRVIESMIIILKNGGVIVPGLGDRPGRRHHKHGNSSNRGGERRRKRGMKEFCKVLKGWVHPMAQKGTDKLMKIVETKIEKKERKMAAKRSASILPSRGNE